MDAKQKAQMWKQEVEGMLAQQASLGALKYKASIKILKNPLKLAIDSRTYETLFEFECKEGANCPKWTSLANTLRVATDGQLLVFCPSCYSPTLDDNVLPTLNQIARSLDY